MEDEEATERSEEEMYCNVVVFYYYHVLLIQPPGSPSPLPLSPFIVSSQVQNVTTLLFYII